MDVRDLEAVLEVADVIQIGARNMQNYPLLTEVGRSGRPALLKRGLSATLDELLMAAEYILKEGNPNVMLCERGIRTFETAYRRFTLDLMAVPVLKELSHLPVIVDPSHAAGRRDLVLPLSLAAAAAGADGIIVEVHPNPDEAVCDGPQALLADDVRRVRGRRRARRGARGQGAQPGVKVAVLGVGLIGGSIGLAARARAGAHVSGYDPEPGVLRAALERGRDRRAGARTSPARSRARTSCSPPRRSGRSPRRCAEALALRRPGLRGQRRRLDQADARGRPTRSALRRRPPARGGRDGRRRARPRGSLRGRDLVSDPGAGHRRGCSTSACTACSRSLGAQPTAIDAERPRPPDGMRLAPPARARQRARRAGALAPCDADGRLPADGPELPRRDAGRRREHRRSGPTSTSPTATR